MERMQQEHRALEIVSCNYPLAVPRLCEPWSANQAAQASQAVQRPGLARAPWLRQQQGAPSGLPSGGSEDGFAAAHHTAPPTASSAQAEDLRKRYAHKLRGATEHVARLLLSSRIACSVRVAPTSVTRQTVSHACTCRRCHCTRTLRLTRSRFACRTPTRSRRQSLCRRSRRRFPTACTACTAGTRRPEKPPAARWSRSPCARGRTRSAPYKGPTLLPAWLVTCLPVA